MDTNAKRQPAMQREISEHQSYSHGRKGWELAELDSWKKTHLSSCQILLT
jgi:hypothetical protein